MRRVTLKEERNHGIQHSDDDVEVHRGQELDHRIRSGHATVLHLGPDDEPRQRHPRSVRRLPQPQQHRILAAAGRLLRRLLRDGHSGDNGRQALRL